MKPKIEYKPEAETLTEALGVTEEEVFRLWTQAVKDAKSGGECLALIWERAPTPEHALAAAFMVGVSFMWYESTTSWRREDYGKNSRESHKEKG